MDTENLNSMNLNDCRQFSVDEITIINLFNFCILQISKCNMDVKLFIFYLFLYNMTLFLASNGLTFFMLPTYCYEYKNAIIMNSAC